MARYFLEVSYDGSSFGGFQIQANQQTIQGEIEKALETIFRAPLALSGASRTDAGVHGLQNFFHFDTDLQIESKHIYNMNALLPKTIVVRTFMQYLTMHMQGLMPLKEPISIRYIPRKTLFWKEDPGFIPLR